MRKLERMSSDAQVLVAGGNAALEAGDWPGARDLFRAALECEETAEALLGLGEALWWLGDLNGSIEYRERAYAAFRRRSDPEQAFLAALLCCLDYRSHVGNPVASAGWLARAKRLVEEFRLDDLLGWLRFAQAADSSDPVMGEQWARQALELARDSSDLDLELCSLSELGARLVQQGRVAEGVACLDEAMAGSLGGEGGSLDTVVLTSCNMMVSCSSFADFERAVHWIRAADRFAERYGCPFLYAECRTVYGGVLVATGAWTVAEEELKAAIESSRDSVPVFHAQAVAALAELRFCQGRLEEAGRLVAGLEDHPAAVPVVARLHLSGGRPEVAAALVQRRLQMIGEARLESGPLLELLGEAEIAQGRPDVAAESGRSLVEHGVTMDCSLLVAGGERLLGRVLMAQGDPSAGREHLEAALSLFVELDMPYEVGRTRLLLAESLTGHEREVARAEGRSALATFEKLGAKGDADAAAALLRQLGVRAARAGPRGSGVLTKRETEVLALLGEGLSNPEIADRLYISRKTVEHHVARVLVKLGVRNRAEAAAAAVRRA